MEIAGLLFQQILIMFILMSIGFVFYKIKFISDQGSKDMAKVLLYLVIPVVIVKNFMIERSAENVSALLSSVVVSLIAMGLAILVSYVFFGKKDGVANFSSTFSNAGFIGIPLISATLGEGAVFYISMMIVLINALQWTYGVYVMSGDKSVMKPKNIITNPIVIAVVIGLVLFVSGIQMPVLVTDVFDRYPNPSEVVFRITRNGAYGDINTTYSIVAKGANSPESGCKTYSQILAENNILFPDYYSQVIKEYSPGELYAMLNDSTGYDAAQQPSGGYSMPNYQVSPRRAANPAPTGSELEQFTPTIPDGDEDNTVPFTEGNDSEIPPELTEPVKF